MSMHIFWAALISLLTWAFLGDLDDFGGGPGTPPDAMTAFASSFSSTSCRRVSRMSKRLGTRALMKQIFLSPSVFHNCSMAPRMLGLRSVPNWVSTSFLLFLFISSTLRSLCLSSSKPTRKNVDRTFSCDSPKSSPLAMPQRRGPSSPCTFAMTSIWRVVITTQTSGNTLSLSARYCTSSRVPTNLSLCFSCSNESMYFSSPLSGTILHIVRNDRTLSISSWVDLVLEGFLHKASTIFEGCASIPGFSLALSSLSVAEARGASTGRNLRIRPAASSAGRSPSEMVGFLILVSPFESWEPSLPSMKPMSFLRI
mmetsp:Transcript_27306/g.48269  ORF Transcript_27306/g.48269 Transcript_27306/m.48269 type:complete len:312 (-) Transcript_27306:2048-2983(-)